MRSGGHKVDGISGVEKEMQVKGSKGDANPGDQEITRRWKLDETQHLASLEPAGDTVEVEGMVAPRNGQLDNRMSDAHCTA